MRTDGDWDQSGSSGIEEKGLRYSKIEVRGFTDGLDL